MFNSSLIYRPSNPVDPDCAEDTGSTGLIFHAPMNLPGDWYSDVFEHDVSVFGSPSQSDVIFKCSKSALLEGNVDYLSYLNVQLSSRFKFDFWLYVFELPTAFKGTPIVGVGTGSEGSDGFAIKLWNALAQPGHEGTYSFEVRNAYSSYVSCYVPLSRLNTWHHVTVELNGNLYIGVDDCISSGLATSVNFNAEFPVKIGQFDGAYLESSGFYVERFKIYDLS
ncbi:hypothetical protein [Thiocapsa sp.]|uniref:hypothetical protein n=1 Tax=Thiocapsa sp. TaxID=2024551 RepID=UPI0025E5955B|nr:hypothetical protein [Thiocapsa sp.]